MSDELRMVQGPGKFEGEPVITEFLYTLALNGADDECANDSNWWALLNGPFTSDGQFADVPPTADVTQYERDYLASLSGVILWVDSQGFVTVDFYEEPESDRKEAEWARIQAETSPEGDE